MSTATLEIHLPAVIDSTQVVKGLHPRDLKPCPFCGNQGEVRRDMRFKEGYVVVCEDCGATAGMGFTSRAAVQQWQDRGNSVRRRGTERSR
jgi:Lar family restriction alleviation protein